MQARCWNRRGLLSAASLAHQDCAEQQVAERNSNGTHWRTKPKIGGCTLPFWLDYYIIDVDVENYQYLTASAPGAWWLYIMTRKQCVDDADLAPRLEVVRAMGVNMDKLKRVPQSPSTAAQ